MLFSSRGEIFLDFIPAVIILTYIHTYFVQVPNAVTLSHTDNPDEPIRQLEVNIQLPDGPPPGQAPFQVNLQTVLDLRLCDGSKDNVFSGSIRDRYIRKTFLPCLDTIP